MPPDLVGTSESVSSHRWWSVATKCVAFEMNSGSQLSLASRDSTACHATQGPIRLRVGGMVVIRRVDTKGGGHRVRTSPWAEFRATLKDAQPSPDRPARV
jgi:hypothetical protein